MNIKKLLGNKAHWSVNKHLSGKLGLNATVLLQHLIDLQTSFFKEGHFFQRQEDLIDTIGIGEKALKTARKVLSDNGLIEYKRGYKALYYYTVKVNKILEFFEDDESIPSNLEDDESISSKMTKDTLEDDKGIPHTLTINNNKNKDNKNNIDEVKGKVFFKIVDMYPKNRIGNRQHGLKKFIKLDTNQCKLALTNLNRYLAAADGYTKYLQKYIEEECYSEEWLSAEERNKKNKSSINKGFDTKRVDDEF
tara:strand:- start:2159 stop:2908 length:750 start_codon:yes stop_codon:yes gene_type:complete